MLKHLGSPLRVPTLDTTPTQSPASEAKLSDKKYSKRQEWNVRILEFVSGDESNINW